MSALQYPIGEFVLSSDATPSDLAGWVNDIAVLPVAMRAAVAGLTPAQIDTPYRPGGWTVRQVVHHVPDSHMHAYVRFKLAMTEDEPRIKPYDERRWAELADVGKTDIAVSLNLLDALHARWSALLRSFGRSDFARTFWHPEFGRALTLHESLARYAWHGRHHVAHITALREREGWG
jgi:hypothetical protein